MSTTAGSEIEETTAAVLLLTVEDAAQRLSIGRTTMYSLISAGAIQSVTIGRLRRIPSECLEEYVAGLRTSGQPESAAAQWEVTVMGPNANGRSSIYQNAEGWHGRVTVGVKDDGRPDRRHVRGKTKAEVTAKVRKLEKLRDESRVPKDGQRWTVAKWLTYWIENIAVPPNVSENAHSGYSVDVRKHLIPGVGTHWLDRLEPEHLEKLYAKMQRSGLAAGTAHHVHRTIRNALNEAVRRGHLGRNPVLLAKAPKLTDEEPEPCTIEEVQRLLKVAANNVMEPAGPWPRPWPWRSNFAKAKRSGSNGIMWT
jgi:excisionase family DNA binding protein